MKRVLVFFLLLSAIYGLYASSIQSIKVLDLNKDGQIDAVDLYVTANIDDENTLGLRSTASNADKQALLERFSFTSDINPVQYAISTGERANDNIFRILIEAEEGTSVTFSIDYDCDPTIPASKVITGTTDYLLSFSGHTVSDRANPIVKQTIIRDTNHNGKIDQVVIVFTEEMNPSFTATTGISFGGAYVGAVMPAFAANGTWSVNNTTYTFDITNESTYTSALKGNTGDLLNAITFTSPALIDLVGNKPELGSYHGGIVLSDEAQPKVFAREFKDSDANGTFDEIVITLTEAVSYAGSLIADDFTIVKNDLSDLGNTYTSNDGTGNSRQIILVASTPSNTTGWNNAPTIQYTYDGTHKIYDTGGNYLASDGSAVAITDAALPILLSKEYRDTGVDGSVDRVVLTYSEKVHLPDAGLNQITFIQNSLTGLNGTPLSLSGNGTTILTLTVPATTNLTGVGADGTQPMISYAKSATVADRIIDNAGNEFADLSATALTDAAAPLVFKKEYKDNGNDGSIDRVEITFTEKVWFTTADIANDFAIVANNLTGIGTAFSASVPSNPAGTASVISFTTAAATSSLTGVSGATEPTIAYTWDATNSISDNYGNRLASFTATAISDAAPPVMLATSFYTATTTGYVNKATVAYTENVVWNQNDISQFQITANDIPLEVNPASVDVVSTNTIRLNVTATSAKTGVGSTGVEPRITYSLSSTANNQVKDAAGNTIACSTSLLDSAVPVVLSSEFQDTNADGNVETIYMGLSEKVIYTAAQINNNFIYTIGGLTGMSTTFSTYPTSTGDKDYLTLIAGSPSTNKTGVNGSALPTIAYNYDSGSLIADSRGNYLASTGALNCADKAKPICKTITYFDISGDAIIDAVDCVFTEYISGNAASMVSFTANSLTGFAGSITSSVPSASSLTLEVTSSNQKTGVGTGTQPTMTYTPGANIDNRIKDVAGNEVATITNKSLLDGANPIIISRSYKDSGNDGNVETIELTFSEEVTGLTTAAATSNVGLQVNGLSMLATVSSVSPTSTTAAATRTIVYSTTSPYTGTTAGNEPKLKYSNTAVIKDASNNAVLTESAYTIITDAARPIIKTATYTDTNADGYVDQFTLNFSEEVIWNGAEATQFTTTANGLTGFASTITNINTTNASSYVFTITTTSLKTGVNGGTEPSILYTASSTAANKIVDNVNNILYTAVKSFTDKAKPIAISREYKSSAGTGNTDNILITYSENCSAATINNIKTSFAITANGLTGLATTATGASATSNSILLTFSSGSYATGITGTTNAPTILYTDNSGNHILDTALNAVATDASAVTLTDKATPYYKSATFYDRNNNAKVDHVVLKYTEPVTYNGSGISFSWGGMATRLTDYTIASAVATNDSIVITFNEGAEKCTGPYSSSTAAKVVYTLQTAPNGIIDLASNSMPTVSPYNLTDTVAPSIDYAIYKDNNNDNSVDEVWLYTTERVTGTAANLFNDFAVTPNDLTGLGPNPTSIYGTISGYTYVRLQFTNTSLVTGHTNAPLVSYTYDGTNALKDASNYSLQSFSNLAIQDATAPHYESSSFSDEDGDGIVETITVNYSERVQIDTPNDSYTKNQFTFVANSLTGLPSHPTNVSCNGSSVILTANRGVTGTNASPTLPTVAYTANSTDTYKVKDFALTAQYASTFTAKNVTDAAKPVILSRSYLAVGGNLTNTINITYSEPITFTNSSFAINDFSVVANGLTGVSTFITDIQFVSGNTYALTLGSGSTYTGTEVGQEPTLRYIYDGSSKIIDANANYMSTESAGHIIADAAKPYILSTEYSDANADAVIDQISLIFSEKVNYNSGSASDWVLGGNDLTWALTPRNTIKANSHKQTVERTNRLFSSNVNNNTISISGFYAPTAGISSTHLPIGNNTDPTIAYTGLATGITDMNSNTLVGTEINHTLVLADKAKPVFLSIIIEDGGVPGLFNNPGDHTTMNFSETIISNNESISALDADILFAGPGVEDAIGVPAGQLTTDGSSPACTFAIQNNSVTLAYHGISGNPFRTVTNAPYTLTFTSNNGLMLKDALLNEIQLNNAITIQLPKFSFVRFETKDIDHDGYIDNIVVIAGRNLDDSSRHAENWKISKNSDMSNPVNFSFNDTYTNDETNDANWYLSVNGHSLGWKTDERPYIQYTPTQDLVIYDLYGATTDATTALQIEDKSAPVIMTEKWFDHDNNGDIDYVTVSFSEKIGTADVHKTGISLGNFAINSGELNSLATLDDTTYAFTINGFIGTNQHGNQIHENLDNLTRLIDWYGNSLVNQSPIYSLDCAAPIVKAFVYVLNGSILPQNTEINANTNDTVEYYFATSEPLNTNRLPMCTIETRTERTVQSTSVFYYYAVSYTLQNDDDRRFYPINIICNDTLFDNSNNTTVIYTDMRNNGISIYYNIEATKYNVIDWPESTPRINQFFNLTVEAMDNNGYRDYDATTMAFVENNYPGSFFNNQYLFFNEGIATLPHCYATTPLQDLYLTLYNAGGVGLTKPEEIHTVNGPYTIRNIQSSDIVAPSDFLATDVPNDNGGWIYLDYTLSPNDPTVTEGHVSPNLNYYLIQKLVGEDWVNISSVPAGISHIMLEVPNNGQQIAYRACAVYSSGTPARNLNILTTSEVATDHKNLYIIHLSDYIQNSTSMQREVFIVPSEPNSVAGVDNVPAYMQLSAYLEGAYQVSTHSMNTALNQLPLTSPYTDHVTVTALPVIQGKQIVDWIEIQLRNERNNLSTAKKCSAFLLNDGSIVDPQGNTTLPFYYTSGQQYYVVLHHRNHVDIMTEGLYTLGDAVEQNLVLNMSQTPYQNNAKEVEPGIFAMYAGDADGNGQIQNNDRFTYYRQQKNQTGYLQADFNLDGQVNESDLINCFYPNVGRGCGFQVAENQSESVMTTSTVAIAKKETSRVNDTRNTMNYSFTNIRVTGNNPAYLEYDIAVDGAYTQFADAQVYLQYNTDMFGSRAVNASHITVSRSEMIGNQSVYTPIIVNDQTDNCFSIALDGSTVGTYDNTQAMMNNATKLFHVSMQIENEAGEYGLQFSDTLMQNQSTYFNADNSLVAYTTITVNSSTTGNADPSNPDVPKVTVLHNAYPNPFNPTTTIAYELKNAGNVKVAVFNAKGQLVKVLTDAYQASGIYSKVWDGKDNNGIICSSGVYFCRMQTSGYSQSVKLMLLK